MCGLVVKWLSRLPVTEEIAGSNPVELAIALIFYLCYSKPSLNYSLGMWLLC